MTHASTQTALLQVAGTFRLLWIAVLATVLGHPLLTAADAVSTRSSWEWMGPDGQSLALRSVDEALLFLETAQVVKAERVGKGINNPFKVLLQKDGVMAHACFRDVKVFRKEASLADDRHFNFRDDAIFEVAAFRVATLLGMKNVPPVVERKLFGKRGTLQLWVENAFSEETRLQESLRHSDPRLWSREYRAMLVFDALIGNIDRNQGNILFDSSWKRWLIDHTRSFRTSKQVELNGIKSCDRRLWEALLGLDRGQLNHSLRDYLSRYQIDALMARRDLLVAHLQERIDRWGESVVLVDRVSD